VSTVDKLIKVASAEVGYLEKASNKDLDSKTKNVGSRNFTKYGLAMGCNGYPWCDAFVDWCFVKAYGKATAKKLLNGFSNSTITSASYFKNKKQWHKNPKVGDQIFFKNSAGTICHTGLVYQVDEKYVYTIEGNTSMEAGVVANGGGVRKKKYALSYARIAGYGRPDYSIVKK
jgi:hypothetical protein